MTTPGKKRKMNDSGNVDRILRKIAKIIITTISCLVATLVAFVLPWMAHWAMKKTYPKLIEAIFISSPSEPRWSGIVIFLIIPSLVMATAINNEIFAKIWGWRPILKKNTLRKLLAKLILAPIILYISGVAFFGLLGLTELGKTQQTQNSRTYKRKYTPTELCYARIYTISFRRSKNFFSASSDANRVCNTNMNCIPRRAIPYQISACSRFIGNSRLYKTCTNGIKQSLCY